MVKIVKSYCDLIQLAVEISLARGLMVIASLLPIILKLAYVLLSSRFFFVFSIRHSCFSSSRFDLWPHSCGLIYTYLHLQHISNNQAIMPAAGLNQPKPKRFNPHHTPKKPKGKDKKKSNRLGDALHFA